MRAKLLKFILYVCVCVYVCIKFRKEETLKGGHKNKHNKDSTRVCFLKKADLFFNNKS